MSSKDLKHEVALLINDGGSYFDIRGFIEDKRDRGYIDKFDFIYLISYLRQHIGG